MRRITQTSWFLLLYWVPLVNLGPSLHKADFFGFHSHHCGSSHCHHGSLEVGGHCFQSPFDESSDCHSHLKEDPSQTPQRFVTGSDSDCSLCQFFDQYNVVINTLELPTHVNGAYQRNHFELGIPASALLEASARAPPFSAQMG